MMKCFASRRAQPQIGTLCWALYWLSFTCLIERDFERAGTFADQWLATWLTDKTLARSDKGLGGLTYTYRTHPTDEALECYLAPLVSSPERKALVQAYAMALAPNPLAGIEPALRRCAAPTRIVWGTGDDIFSAASPAYLDRTCGNSRGVRTVAEAKLFWPDPGPPPGGDPPADGSNRNVSGTNAPDAVRIAKVG